MALVYENNRGSYSVDKVGAFSQVLHNGIPRDMSFNDIVAHIGDEVKAEYDVTQGALNNCNGDWYEWLIAIKAWNKRVQSDKEQLAALLLPKVSSYNVADLYVDEISDLIADLISKVSNSTDVELITSNPDFVLIDPSHIDLPHWFHEPIDLITEDVVGRLESAYKCFHDQCELNHLRGYISVKKSMRPDRRLQIPHEGSLMKAIYTHIQTREWIMEPQGIRYYAASADLTGADRAALKTVATHSITTVHKLPQAAVDDAFIINEPDEVDAALEAMLAV